MAKLAQVSNNKPGIQVLETLPAAFQFYHSKLTYDEAENIEELEEINDMLKKYESRVPRVESQFCYWQSFVALGKVLNLSVLQFPPL